MSLTLAFDETGGYDCMTGAYQIADGDRILCTVDLRYFGQPARDYSFRSVEAEEVAKTILAALQSMRADSTDGTPE